MTRLLLFTMRRVTPEIRARIIKIAIESDAVSKKGKFEEAKSILFSEYSYNVTRSFFYKLLNQPEVEPPQRAKRMKTVVIDENIESIVELINEYNGRISIRAIQSETGISYSSVRRMLKELRLHPYKPIRVQKLTDQDKERRLTFCNLMLTLIQDDNEFHRKIIFTDETMVETERAPNSQNDRRWSESQPYDFHQHSCYSKKILIWSGINYRIGCLPAFTLESGRTRGVGAAAYQELLLERVFPYLRENHEHQLAQLIWQQDGAPAHRTLDSISCIRTQFDQIIGFNGDILWPPRSPDLNPCDYYLWPTVKARTSAHDDTDAALTEFTDRMNAVTIDEIHRAIDNFPKRLEACIGADGGHFVLP